MVETKIFHDNVDYIQVSELFQNIWGGNINIITEKTHWAFVRSKSLVILAYDDQKLIAVRGGFEWPLNYNENEISAYQLHGTCVHEDYRRLRLFTRLTKTFISELQTLDVSLIFNVSVNASRLGYEKMGWVYLKGFKGLTCFCKPLKIIRIIKYRSNKTLYNTISESSNEQILLDEELFKRRKIQFKDTVHTNYSNSFLLWRLSLGGYKVLKNEYGAVIYKVEVFNGIRALRIGEYFLYENSYKYFNRLHKQLLSHENPDTMEISMFNTHPYYRHLRKKLFFPNPKHLNLNFGVRQLKKTDDFINKSFAFSTLDIDTF